MKAIITGASKGIGRAIAEEFAQRGISLILCSRNLEEIQSLALALHQSHGIEAHGIDIDVRQKSDIQRLIDFARQTWDRVDILVNNAGIFYPGNTTEESEENLPLMIETNLYSAYYLTRGILPLMTPQRKGYIFNMCSIASFMAYPNGGSYSISKFALLGYTKVLRAELKTEGIKVIAVMPGATWSDSWKGVDLPHERLMEASDIATMVGAALDLSDAAVMEEIILRPQLGDL